MVKNPLFISSFIIAVLIYSGFLKIENKNNLLTLAQRDQIIKIQGYITSNPIKTNFSPSSYKANFETEKIFTKNGIYTATGEVEVYFPSAMVEAYYPGKIYTLNKTERLKNTFIVENGAKLLIDVEKSINSDSDYFIVKNTKGLGWKGNHFIQKILHFRALCRLQFKRLMYTWNDAGGLLLSLLTGSREYTDKNISDGFRNSGLAHLLALSGMHLGLFGSLAYFFTNKAMGRNIGDAFQLLAVSFFIWFAGCSPSLFRAFIAAIILYFNSLFRMNRPDSLSVLSLCFLIHLVSFPNHIYEAAFMLSYSSLCGIIIFSKMYKKVYPIIIPYKIREALATSTSAQTATIPISLKIFNKIAPQGIIASVFVSPLIFIFIYFGLFGTIICLILPFLSLPFSVIMNGLYFLIYKLVLFFS